MSDQCDYCLDYETECGCKAGKDFRALRAERDALKEALEEIIDWLRDLSDSDMKRELLDHIIAADKVAKEAIARAKGGGK